MSEGTSKSARRRQRRAAKKAQAEGEMDDLQYSLNTGARGNVSPGGHSASSFADKLSPTAQEIAQMDYAAQLGDPGCNDSGIPLIIGGLCTKSVKVTLEQYVTFAANASGEAWLVMYAHIGSPSDNPDSKELLARIPSVQAGDQTNKCVIGAASLSGGSSLTPLSGFPIVGGAGLPIYVPQSGLDLTRSEARLVAQELSVQPTSNNLTTAGMGMITRSANINAAASPFGVEASLAGESFDSASALQGNPKHSAALARWDPETWFNANWLPQTVANVSFSPCVLPDVGDTREDGTAGYSAFFATGCAPGQTFGAWVKTVYEVKNDEYGFATQNVPTGGGLEVAASASGVMTPSVIHREIDGPVRGLQSAVESQRTRVGPGRLRMLARNFFTRIKNRIMPALGRARRLLPTLLGVAGTGAAALAGIAGGPIASVGTKLAMRAITNGLRFNATPSLPPHLARATRPALAPPVASFSKEPPSICSSGRQKVGYEAVTIPPSGGKCAVSSDVRHYAETDDKDTKYLPPTSVCHCCQEHPVSTDPGSSPSTTPTKSAYVSGAVLE